MSQKTVARIAWTLCTLVVIAAVFNAIWNLTMRNSAFTAADTLATFGTFIAFGVMGALIVSHQPRNRVGWLLMIEAGLVFVWPLDTYFNSLTQAPVNPSWLTLIGLWLYSWLWLWYIFPILFIPLFFPTGRLPSGRWRWLVALGLGLCLFFILFVTFLPEFIAQDESWSVPNPIGFLREAAFPYGLWVFLLLSFAALSVVALFVRYRRARRAERAQIKWLLSAAALFFGLYAVSFLTNEVGGIANQILDVLIGLAIPLLPTAIAIAILRHRLYDIDLVIRKTLVYAVLSGLLALVYFGSVVLLQTIFDSVAQERSPFIIVVSTLLIAALFAPLRRRVQAFIDRRFYRQKYDAQQVLARFAQAARDEVEMDNLTAELLSTIQEIMQPEQLSLWLPSDQRAKS